jgi:hypothetical protein
MRLINAKSLTIESFFNKEVPQYAILSHRWGDDEVSLQDMEAVGGHARTKAGYIKIRRTCEQALRHHLNYVWVDTCCIDKTSSAELSEAINSMFTWYRRARICYAFLEDVSPDADPHDSGGEFIHSEWFTRGWTLQELLAPSCLEFYASDWSLIAPRSELIPSIATATGIDKDTMRQVDRDGVEVLRCISIAERMSWAANRRTTRVEDIAYCLLGMFEVNMPLLYGEGERAFRRLQEEIIKRSADQSIFAWGHEAARSEALGIFAVSPACFARCGDIIQCKTQATSSATFSLTSLGVQIQLPVVWLFEERLGYYALLQCRPRHLHDRVLAVPIEKGASDTYTWSGTWYRTSSDIIAVHHRERRSASLRLLCIASRIDQVPSLPSPQTQDGVFWIRSIPKGFDIESLQASCKWDKRSRILTTQRWATGNDTCNLVDTLFYLSTGTKRRFLGIQLRVKAPYKLFSWVVPSWAVCRAYTLSQAQLEDWLKDPTILHDGTWYATLPDGFIVYPTVTSENIQGTSLFIVDIHSIPSNSLLFRWRLLSKRIKLWILYMIEELDFYPHDRSYIQLRFPPHTWVHLRGFMILMVAHCLLMWGTERVVPHEEGFFLPPDSPLLHVVDLAWYLMAALWGMWDTSMGRTAERIPIALQCLIYAVLTRLTLIKSPLALWALFTLSCSLNYRILRMPNSPDSQAALLGGLLVSLLITMGAMQNSFGQAGP